MLQAARGGDESVRLAAIQVVGKLGDESTVPALLEIAAADDAELSQAAMEALGRLRGENVNAELTRRLADADGKSLAVLIELVGQRRIGAVAELVKALHHSDEATRNAALVALGAAAGAERFGFANLRSRAGQGAIGFGRCREGIAGGMRANARSRGDGREACRCDGGIVDGHQGSVHSNLRCHGRAEGAGDDRGRGEGWR